MSSTNVLPSAPPETSPLYLQLQPNFRMQKIHEISVALNKEVGHYWAVAKKYKCAKKFVSWSAAGSSVLSAAFSSVSLGSALSVVGLLATIPLGSVGRSFTFTSSGLMIASKKLDSKVKKHHKIDTLAITKCDLVDQLLSKVLGNNQISDREFQLIMTEFSQCNVLKEAMRAKLTQLPSHPDVEKIKKGIHSEIDVEADFMKKLNVLHASWN